VVSFMPQLLYPWIKSLHFPFSRWLGGPQTWSGHDMRKSLIIAPVGNQIPVTQPRF